MSDPNAVWPDGTRWAVGQAHDQWMKRSQFDPTSVVDDLLTALEPFVQQRIAEARPVCSVCAGKGTPVSGGACICGGIGTQAAELQGFRAEVARLREEAKERQAGLDAAMGRLRAYEQVLRDHDNTATPDVMRGLLDQFKSCREERDRLRAEVARLREDGERLDWLERSVPNGDLRRIVDSGKVPAVWPSSVRGFIDAARSARGGEGP